MFLGGLFVRDCRLGSIPIDRTFRRLFMNFKNSVMIYVCRTFSTEKIVIFLSISILASGFAKRNGYNHWKSPTDACSALSFSLISLQNKASTDKSRGSIIGKDSSSRKLRKDSYGRFILHSQKNATGKDFQLAFFKYNSHFARLRVLTNETAKTSSLSSL